MGALSEFVKKQFGVNTVTHINPITDTVQTTATKILNNNPDRLAVVIINLGSNPVYVSVKPDVSTSKGIRLATNGGGLILNAKDDLELVGYEFWAIADGGSSTIFVMEVEAE